MPQYRHVKELPRLVRPNRTSADVLLNTLCHQLLRALAGDLIKGGEMVTDVELPVAGGETVGVTVCADGVRAGGR